MAKTTALTRLKEQLSVCDVVFEVRDARLPLSSRHPSSDELFGKGPRIIVLTKKDLCDPNKLAPWLRALSGERCRAIGLSLKTQTGKNALIKLALDLTAEKREARKRKGLLPRPIRACIVGLPNVGKSTLVNWLTGRKKAPVADRPGVTKAPQWVRIHPQVELLDTPGILPPVMFSGPQSVKLALCNVLPADHFDAKEVAVSALEMLAGNTTASITQHYGLEANAELSLDSIAKSRSCLQQGGTPDDNRAASMIIQDFRTGKLGGSVLDTLPEEWRHKAAAAQTADTSDGD